MCPSVRHEDLVNKRFVAALEADIKEKHEGQGCAFTKMYIDSEDRCTIFLFPMNKINAILSATPHKVQKSLFPLHCHHSFYSSQFCVLWRKFLLSVSSLASHLFISIIFIVICVLSTVADILSFYISTYFCCSLEKLFYR